MAHVLKRLTSRDAVERRSSLRVTLILRVLIPLIVAMGIFSYLLLWMVERNVEGRLKEDVELVARAIHLPVSASLERGREGSVEQALESVFKIGRVYGAYVYDDRGDLAAAVGAVRPDAPRRELDELPVEGGGAGEYERIEGREVYSYFLPLTETGGRINGLLQVTRRESDFVNDIRRLRFQAVGLMVLLTTIASGLVLSGHRAAIGRHLHRLASSMARIERGQRSHRARATGPREVAALSTALNGMLDGIERAEREIARNHKAQAALEHRLRQAEKMAAIGRLAAGVAHELGSPLSVIDGKAQRGLRDRALSERQARNLHQIRDEVARLSKIVRQLLDFGRAAGRHRRVMAAGEIVAAARDEVAQDLRKHGVTLEVLPPATDVRLPVDPLRIEQALTNLLRNGVQASPGGRLRLAWTAEDAHCVFVVEDDGPGIEASLRDSLFEPFVTSKPVGEGTGLGLAVVHGVANDHGGSVEADRSELGGALFRLRIPLNGGDDEGNR